MSSKTKTEAEIGFGRKLARWLARAVEPSRNVDPDLRRMNDRELNDLGIGRGEISRWSGRDRGPTDQRGPSEPDEDSGRNR